MPLRIILALVLSTCLLPPAVAESEQPGPSDADLLTEKIIKLQVELEKFCLNYRLTSSDDSKFKALRYFAGQQAASALQLASGIVSVRQLSKSVPRVRSLRSATRSTMVGVIIGAGSSAFELAANVSSTVKATCKKTGSGSAKMHVISKIREMDDLFRRLDMASESISDENSRRLHQAESKLLKYGRDLCVAEFATWYADSRSSVVGSNVFYILNIASNTLGSVAAGYSLKAFKRPRATASAVVLSTTADSIAIPSAPVSSAATSLLYKHWFKKVHDAVGLKPYDVSEELEQELVAYKHLLADQPLGATRAKFDKRLSLYDFWNSNYLDYELKNRRHLRHLQDVAVESSLDGPLLGGASLSGDICNTSAFFGQSQRPRTARSLNKTAGIFTTTVNASAITLSTINLLSAFRYERAASKRGELPDQYIHKRLHQLSQIEKFYGAH